MTTATAPRMTRAERRCAKLFAEFKPLVDAVLTQSGAEQLPYDEWQLATKAGTLKLSVRAHLSEGCGVVFGRFADPDNAKRFVACNQHSGKWNHHFFGEWTPQAAADEFARMLRKVL